MTEAPTPGGRVIQWFSPYSLSRHWSVSRKTVLRMIKSGELPVLKVNNRVLRISAVDAAACFYRRYGRKVLLVDKSL